MNARGASSKVRYYLYDNTTQAFAEIFDGFACGRLEGDLQFAGDRAVSRKQCQFFISGNDVFVADLESTNRTKVNNVPMQAGSRRRLHLYDVIEFGAQRLVLSHQPKFPANVQDRLASGKLYPVARLDEGKLTSEVSQVFTKKTLLLLDRAKFRKLKLEEAFSRVNRRMRPRPRVSSRPAPRRVPTWVLAGLFLAIGAASVVALGFGGALGEGLRDECVRMLQKH